MILISSKRRIRKDVKDVAEALVWISQYIYEENDNIRFDCPFIDTKVITEAKIKDIKLNPFLLIDVGWKEAFVLTSFKEEEIINAYKEWNFLQ